MELAGDVGWRHHNGKGLFLFVHLCGKVFTIQPFFIQTTLDLLRVVGFFQFFFHNDLLFNLVSQLSVNTFYSCCFVFRSADIFQESFLPTTTKTPSADISCQQRALNTRYHLHLSLIGSFSSTLCPITGAGRDRLLCRLSRPSPETSSCIECFLSGHKQPEFRRPGSRATFGPAHPGFPFSLRGILSFGAEQSYSSPSLPFLFRLLFHYHK